MNARSRIDAAPPLLRSLPVALAAAAFAFLLLIPGAHGQAGAVVWTAPTKADNFRFTVISGSPFSFTLTAAASKTVENLSIEPVQGLPPGASISSELNNGKARAIFTWRPTVVGDYTLRFVAAGAGGSAPLRTYVIQVHPNVRYPHGYRLTDDKVGHWAMVSRQTVVRAQPKPSARAVATLSVLTGDDTKNLVLILDGLDKSYTETWYASGFRSSRTTRPAGCRAAPSGT